MHGYAADEPVRIGAARVALGYVKLSRPPNGLMMFMAVVSGAYVSSRALPSPEVLTLAFITSYGLTGASMAINDVADAEVDRINAPWRPIPSGIIKPKQAKAFSAALALAGLTSSLLISLYCLLIASLSLALAVGYNLKLKPYGLLGNASVSSTVAAPFIYGSVMAIGAIDTSVAILAALAFLSSMGREIIKGMADVVGDSARDVKTVARTRGLRYASTLGASFYLLPVVLSPIPALIGLLSERYLALVAVADAGFVYSAIKIIKRPTPENALRVKKECLMWMAIALLSFLLGVRED